MRLTDRQRQALAQRAVDAVVALGAVPDERDHPEYRHFCIETIYGPLRISPRDTAIRTQFDRVPPVAPSGAPLNRFSGKWNFEFGFAPTAKDLNDAIRCIRAILPQ